MPLFPSVPPPSPRPAPRALRARESNHALLRVPRLHQASFRLRVTALSSRMNNTRFRVRVTVPTHGNPHLPPLLSVLTQPMRSITKLAPKVRNAASLTPTLPGPSSADELSGSNSLTGSASMLNTGTPLLTYSAAMAVHDGSHVFGGVHLERTPSFADFESSAPQTASEASLAPSDCTASPMQRRLKRQRHQQCSVKTEVLDDNHPTFFLNLQGDNGASLKKSKRWQSRFLGLSRLSSNGAAKEEDVEEEGSAQEAEPFFAAALSQLGADAGKDDSLDGFIAAFHDRGGVISEELDSLMSGWPTEMLDLSDDEELGKCARGFAGLPERQKSTHALSAGAACEAEHAVDAVREFVFPPAMVKAQALPSRLPMRVHLVSTGHGTNMSGRRQLEPWLPGTQPASLVKTEKLCKPPNMPQVTQLSTLQTEFEQLKESLASFIGALSAKRAAVC